MNKPVIVSEEALVAPVRRADVAPGLAAKAAVAGPAYIVLAGISFSHFLNDTMQSLIASVYPILKDSYALDYAQIGMITLAFQFTASLLQPVVGHFTDKKAQPFSLAIGMGFTFFGLLLLSVAHSLSRHPDRGGAGRPRLGGVSSGVGADRAAGLGRALWFCAIGVSARRQFRHLDGAGAGGADRGAVRPAQHRLVFLDRVSGDRDPVADRRLVPAADRDQEIGGGRARIRMHPDSRRVKIALAVLVALLFSKQLYVSSLSSYYIFYLIDKFRRLDPGGAALSLHLPRRQRGRRLLRRPARRPLRPQIRHLVLDPRRAAVHAGAALCRPVRQRGADGVHRPDHVVGDVVDHRVRAGTDAAPLRHDLGRVLRRRLRHRRTWRRRARQARRPHRHRLRLSGLRVPAGDRAARGVPEVPLGVT